MGEGLLDRANWVTFEEAVEVSKKSPQTMYRWIAKDYVRVMQPGVTVWLYLPDIWATEKRMRRLGMKHQRKDLTES